MAPHLPNVTIHSGGVAYRLVNGSWTRPADAGANIKYYGFSPNDEPSTSTVPPGQTTTTTAGTVTTTTTTGYTCPPNYPVYCGNGYCCPSNLPVCGTGNKARKCLSKGLCATSFMFGNNSYEANLLRVFRDQVLAKTGKGNELSNLYYQHTSELVAIIFGDSELYKDVMDITVQMIPAIESAFKGSEINIEKDTENKISQLCEKISRKASPDLRQAVEKIRNDFNNGQLLRDIGIKR